LAKLSKEGPTLQEYIRKYRSSLEEKVAEEMRKITEKHGVGYKRDLGFMEFPRPDVSPQKFNQIVVEAEQKLKELGYDWYDVFETTIVVDFPGEKKAYEEWEKGRPLSSHSNPMVAQEGPIRRWLREREPLLKRLRTPQIAIYPLGIDRELESMREAKKREWKAKGYPEGLVDKALMLADRWVSSMAEAFAPPERRDVREAIIRGSYPKALEVGEAWIVAMLK